MSSVHAQVKPPYPPPDPIFHLKVDPETAAAAGIQERIQLIVYLSNRSGTEIARQEKESVLPQLDALNEQLRQVSLPFRREDIIPQPVRAEIRNINLLREQLIEDTRRNTLARKRAAVQDEQDGFTQFVVNQLQGVITARLVSRNAVGVDIPSANFDRLTAHPAVFKVRLARTNGGPELEQSLPLIFDVGSGGSHWHTAYGIKGDGVDDVAILDTGIRSGHNSLSSHSGPEQTFVGGDVGDATGHGTNVAGVVASTNATYTGIARGIDNLIDAKVVTNVPATMTEDRVRDALEWSVEGDTSGGYTPITDLAEIVNFSHGWNKVSQESTDYTNIARDFDKFVDEDWVSIVKSAGNLGTSTGSKQITVPSDAYNIIVVGNMHAADNDRDGDQIESNSSRGPTRGNSPASNPYERKKPDLVAPGYSITTTGMANDNHFQAVSGTSVAAPHVAGAIALLRDVGPWSPTTVKAILINTADDKGSAGWDKEHGWGYINLDTAWDYRWEYSVQNLYPAGQSGFNAYFKGYMSVGDKATAVWNRHEDESDDRLNDIDLWLYRYDPNDPDTIGTALAWSLSTVNNVEQVVMPNTNPTDVIIEVRCFSTSLAGGISYERVSLAFPSGFSAYTPPSPAPQAQPSSAPEALRTEVGQSFPNPFNPETWIPYTLEKQAHVTVEIFNAGGQSVRKLDLGTRPAGSYLTKAKAAYWDGRNDAGEPVASGTYFYYFRAGDFKATRKLVVSK